MEPNPYYWANLYSSRRRIRKESADGFLLWRGPWEEGRETRSTPDHPRPDRPPPRK